MPELPEVETVAQTLRRSLVGQTFTGVRIRWPRTIARPAVDEFTRRIPGRRVLAVGRRGKYVTITLDHGYLLIHLKMSGRLLLVAAGEVPDKHVHTAFSLDSGDQLWFRDVRKFGRVYLVDHPEEVTRLLGPEPLEDGFTLAEFRELLSRRSGRLKSLLLNQEFLAGLGNIYADEALFAAGLHPLRKADTLSAADEERLYGAIRQVLRDAIAGRGTTLEDGGYRDAQGEPGSYQQYIFVYGRQGEPCRRCQTTIERRVIGGRSAHFCPACQPAFTNGIGGPGH
jgi:formamidopyrimidine-DNA glycosylase